MPTVDMTKTSFDRGDVFVATNKDEKAYGNIYAIVRESRPRGDGKFAYNLVNLETGKVRFTDASKVFWNNEPIAKKDLKARFGLDLIFVGGLDDFVPVVREKAKANLSLPDPREVALDALNS